jgi:hypothetical protein
MATASADLTTSESFVEQILLFRNQGNIVKAKNGDKMKSALTSAIPMTEEETVVLDNVYTNLTSTSQFFKGDLNIYIDGFSQNNTFIVNKKNGKIVSSLTLVDDEL